MIKRLICLVGISVVVCPGPLRAQVADYNSELPRIAPTSADKAGALFSTLDDFEMQLVASEPLLGSPVAIEWDAQGGMFVCEMRGYSENRDERLSRIARLVDQDNDGVYDHRTEYAIDLNWPTGLFPYDGGLIVGDAPDLWYFKDTDNDGVADIRKRVMTGFGTSNVQGLFNSFRWGLDNRVNVACSSTGGDVQTVIDDQLVGDPVSIRGRDIAIDPRTFKFELTSGAAQHGMCFDDWGRKFVSSNSDHIQQVMYEDRYIARNPYFIPLPSRISIAEDGPQAEVYRTSPVEPWRIVRTRLRVSGAVKGPIEGGGRAAGYFTGATGVTVFRGDAWPEQMLGLAIVGDVGGNLIHRKRLVGRDIEFSAQRIDPEREFVSSKDIWFRPVQFAGAPDGSLHVVDMYREVIEHPASLPPEIKQHLDLTSGRDRGRIYRLVPAGNRPRANPHLAKLSTHELVRLLEHRNAWHRETSARLLFERQDPSAVEPLRELSHVSDSPLGRMHALYALDGLNALDEKTILARLKDSHPQVRRHAIRLSEKITFTQSLGNAIAPLVDDPDIEVRYQLAFTIGSVPISNRVSLLASLTRQDNSNQWMRVALVSSMVSDAAAVYAQLAADERFRSPDAEAFLKDLAKQMATQQRLAGTGNDTSVPKLALDQPVRHASAQRAAIIERYQSALTLEADIHRGAELFGKHCSGCHRVGTVGTEIGPNLATMKSRGAESILTGILDPNREVNPQFLNYTVLLADGRVTTGMITDEGTTSIILKRQQNIQEPILKVEIELIKNSGVSLMPEGFEAQLDPQAIADLIEFLLKTN